LGIKNRGDNHISGQPPLKIFTTEFFFSGSHRYCRQLIIIQKLLRQIFRHNIFMAEDIRVVL